jgi:hypothetical protein
MKNLFLFIIIISLAFACEKKKNEEPDNNDIDYNTPPPAVAPNLLIVIPSDARAVLQASRIPYSFGTTYTTSLGKASAYFYTSPGNYTYVDAGLVKCNDSTLTKLSGGSYMFSGTPVNGQPQSGINFSAGAAWSVAGSASVPAFTYTNTLFPSDAILTSGTTILKNTNNTVTFSSPNNADSVVITIGCDSGLVKKTVLSTSGSCQFTAAEVNRLKKKYSSAKGYLNFMSYNMTSNTVSGSKHYFISSSTATYSININ